MKRLTLKEMSESQQRVVQTKLAQAKKSLGRPLTNAEHSKIKNQAIDEIMLELKKQASRLKAEKNKQKLAPSTETFDWSAQNHSRGLR